MKLPAVYSRLLLPTVLLMATSCLAQDMFDEWLPIDLPGGFNLPRGMAAGNGTYVVAGYGGLLATSTDGVAWEKLAYSALPPDNYEAIAFGNGLFTIIGEIGSVLTSSNGLAWVQGDCGVEILPSSMAFGAGQFVVVDHSGLIVSSTNGQSWKATHREADSELRDVAFGAGQFVAVGGKDTFEESHSLILTSPDGQQWSERRNVADEMIYQVAYGNGRFVAIGSYSFMGLDWFCLTSTNGIDWDYHWFSDMANDLVFGNGAFLAVGNSGLAWSSTDGEEWIPHRVANFDDLAGAGYGPAGFFALGQKIYLARTPSPSPVVVKNPQSKQVFAGASTTLQVETRGNPPLQFQWTQDGKPILQATNYILLLADIQTNHQADYRVIVSNAYGSVTSSPARLSVLLPAEVDLPFNYYMVSRTKEELEAAGTTVASFSFDSVIELKQGFYSLDSALLRIPGGDTASYDQYPSLTDSPNYYIGRGFSSPGPLWTAFLNGLYEVNIRSSGLDVWTDIRLDDGNFPSAPLLQNWGSGQKINPGEPALVRWSLPESASSNDFAVLSVYGNQQMLYSTPMPGGKGSLKASEQGAVIPAEALWQSSTNLSCILGFYRVISRQTNLEPYALGVACYGSRARSNLPLGPDTRPPQLKSFSPLNQGTNRADQRTIVFWFDEPMGPGYSIQWSTNVQASQFQYWIHGDTLTCSYPINFPTNTWIDWTLNPTNTASTNIAFASGFPDASSLRDLAGNRLPTTSGRLFITEPENSQPATNILRIHLFLARSMAQNSPRAPFLSARLDDPLLFNFYAQLDGRLTAETMAALHSPNGKEIELHQRSNSIDAYEGFTAESAIRSVYTNGLYRFVLSNQFLGNQSFEFDLQGDFPPAPRVANYEALQQLRVDQPFTLAWDPLPLGPGDVIWLSIRGDRPEDPEFLASNVGEGIPLAYNATSVTIPAHTFKPGQAYRCGFVAAKVTTRVPLSSPGTEGLAGLQSTTEFSFNTPSQVLDINPTALPAAAVNTPYSLQLQASGGSAAYKWKLIQGSALPPGLSLSPEGRISGTPAAGGSYVLGVLVTDQGPYGYATSKVMSLEVSGSSPSASILLQEPRISNRTHLVFRLAGKPQANCRLETSTNLKEWTPGQSVTLPDNGWLWVTNPVSLTVRGQYFRAVQAK